MVADRIESLASVLVELEKLDACKPGLGSKGKSTYGRFEGLRIR